MGIPFDPELFGIAINIHLVLECLAYFIGFRYYLYLRQKSKDPISSKNRLSILLGAILGGYLGSRLFGYLENPVLKFSSENLVHILNSKTIMGGLFGGLIGVETAKKIIGENQSSGDLYTLPILLGLFIGRIGCFLSGINEFTYGKVTDLWVGMDLGDGLYRHPISLYELLFLTTLFIILKRLKNKSLKFKNGALFKLFMVAYFGFRFIVEFLKPNVFYVFGLSSIQWLCIVCWLYYFRFIKSAFHAQ